MSVIDAFFPPICVGCRYVGSYLCPNCSNTLTAATQDRCLVCNLGSDGTTHAVCRTGCSVDLTMSIYKYRGAIRQIIKLCKYQLTTQVWEKTKHLMNPAAFYKLAAISRGYPTGILVPIPLHPARLRERGFNQSILIARFFSQLLKMPIEEPLMRRKNTLSQASINEYGKRQENMKGSFVVKDEHVIANRSFILVDDVITSGSTMCAAAYALKSKGAAQIVALSLARG